jgi:hypothetical protein
MTLIISEHAMVRYCERVMGLTREELAASMTAALGELGDGRHKIPGHPVLAVVKNRTIVTFIPEPVVQWRAPKKKKKKRIREIDGPWISP